MGTTLMWMIFFVVMLEPVASQITTDTNKDDVIDSCATLCEQQGRQIHLLQQFQQNLANQMQSFQQQLREQSELIQQLKNQTRDSGGNCGSDPTVLYYNFQFQSTPLVYRRSRDQLVCELQTSCNPLLIQQNVDGSNFFDRTWEEFKVGFNGSNGNYWLGNELLHQLTVNNRYKLRFDLQSLDNHRWYWAEYSTFTVGSEATCYTLQVGGFTGNVSQEALSYHNGTKFTTKDRDNDLSNIHNCAVYNGGGFWGRECSTCDVNTQRGRGNDFRWPYLTIGNNSLYQSLQTSRMWLMCR